MYNSNVSTTEYPTGIRSRSSTEPFLFAFTRVRGFNPARFRVTGVWHVLLLRYDSARFVLLLLLLRTPRCFIYIFFYTHIISHKCIKTSCTPTTINLPEISSPITPNLRLPPTRLLFDVYIYTRTMVYRNRRIEYKLCTHVSFWSLTSL